MPDGQAKTATPDAAAGNAIAVVIVTNASSQVVDQQVVTIGDKTDGTLHAGVTASGLQVQIGAVAQGTAGASAWLISGAVTVTGTVANATGSATIGSVALVTGAAVIGALATGSATLGSVALVTGAAVIGALATGTATIGAVTVATGAAVIGSINQGTSPWVISGGVSLATAAATIGQVVLATGAAVIGALTANQSVTGAMTQGTTPWVDNITQLGGVSMIGVAKGTQATNAFATQDMKDSGRSYRTFIVASLTGITTEALLTMNINSAGTVTTATTYTVTAGKTLRIQSIHLAAEDTTTTAVAARLTLRSAATVTVGSAAAIHIAVKSPGAVANEGGQVGMDIPDGLEIAGGQQIGLSHQEASTSSTITASVVGYEY